jgi:molybdopterin-synthase adenylyltransferase
MISRYSRQSFIGEQSLIEGIKIGVVGLGGGGSAIIMQLAHIGFLNYTIFDPNTHLELKHLNRTFGVTLHDVLNGKNKIFVAERTVKGLQPGAQIKSIQGRWQDNLKDVSECKIIIGCVDSLADREQLEIYSRGKSIPYIDIGLGIHNAGNIPQMAGQVILSLPGHACMRCMGFINETALAREAGEYGNAGPRPQVIWGNSVLAGAATGIAVKLTTGWAGKIRPVYLQYNGNDDTILPHPRTKILTLDKPCPHFPTNTEKNNVFEDL